MYEVSCHTNLDLNMEEWPSFLPFLPNVGDHIQSSKKYGLFQLELQVVRITWKFNEYKQNWIPHIELHMTDWQKRMPATKSKAADGSITAFYEWYAPHVARSVGSFI